MSAIRSLTGISVPRGHTLASPLFLEADYVSVGFGL
jgi:hypothetical protein